MESLIRTIRRKGQDVVLIRTGLTASFYLDAPLPDCAPACADAIEAYLAYVGAETLRTYVADNGQFRPLTSRQIAKDLRNLRGRPTDEDGYRVHYSQGSVGGEPGTHALFFEGDGPSEEPVVFPDAVSLLRLEFPPPPPDDDSWMAPFLELIRKIANLIPFQSGNAGWGFKHMGVHESEERREINQLLPRYHSFDPAYDSVRMWMRNHTWDAQWLTLLRDDLIQKLGGRDAIRAALPHAELQPLDYGVLIRAAKRPPVGDVNRQCLDIGSLPDVARLLRPIRLTVKGFGEPREVFDAPAWIARYDNKPSQPWDAK